MRLRPALAAALSLVVLLAACRTAPAGRDYLEYASARDPGSTATALSKSVQSCWLAGKRPAFAAYTSAAELTSLSGRPRVLIVRKRDPHGLPALVLEASPAPRGARVKLFGPLLAGPDAAAIRADVARWAGGAPGC